MYVQLYGIHIKEQKPTLIRSFFTDRLCFIEIPNWQHHQHHQKNYCTSSKKDSISFHSHRHPSLNALPFFLVEQACAITSLFLKMEDINTTLCPSDSQFISSSTRLSERQRMDRDDSTWFDSIQFNLSNSTNDKILNLFWLRKLLWIWMLLIYHWLSFFSFCRRKPIII